MNKCINKNEEFKILKQMYDPCGNDDMVVELKVKIMLTSNAEEVKYAYWIPVTYGECKCSICGNIYGLCGGLMGDYNYCPGCGARMDKEKEDETH